jgi:hypothetical protein
MAKTPTSSKKDRAAVLRAGQPPNDASLEVDFGRRHVWLELKNGGKALASGHWKCHVRENGSSARPAAPWEQVLRVSDEEADYLELSGEWSGGLMVERHVFLARKDEFLLLADAVLARQPTDLEYRSHWRLGPGVVFRGAKQSREGFLVARRRRALVLPLALPEWRAETGSGLLAQADDGLQLRQTVYGRRLFAPLFFDLAPARFGQPLTWRRLTVAERLRAVADDTAVGFRVQIGDQQWLIYRSLAPKANRTLLGHNLSSETLVARFRRDGEVEALLEVE